MSNSGPAMPQTSEPTGQPYTKDPFKNQLLPKALHFQEKARHEIDDQKPKAKDQNLGNGFGVPVFGASYILDPV